MSRKRVVSIEVSTGTYGSFVERIAALAVNRSSSYVCVANVHMVVEAFSDSGFASIVNSADLVTPDGMPLSKSIGLLYGLKQERVAGMDLLPDLLGMAREKRLSVYLFGSTETVLETIEKKIAQDFPGLTVAGAFSPSFRPATPEETEAQIARINESGANLVLVALGCPKQERWMAANKGRISAVMVGIGGAFPVYAGLQKRAPKLLQRLSLEWFYRLCQEPRRLFKRYLVTNTVFLSLLMYEFVLKNMSFQRR